MAFKLERGRNENFKLIGTYDKLDEAFQAMRVLLALEKFDSMYTRQWVYEDGYTYIDYGSHHDFFRYKEEL
jgi:hypothetical protein